MPIMLFIGVVEGRQFYVNQKYLTSLKWVLLEIIAPPEVEKSPKVAEYIFAALHGIYLPVNWKARFFQGKVVDWFSFEIVSTNGAPHFYIRTPEAFKNLVETQIFAQYPQAEIKVVERDYVQDLPLYLPNDKYNLFGAELIFDKPNSYPIRTYEEFEELGTNKEAEYKRTDPLASIFEILSTLQGGEHIWIQMIARPTGGDWREKAQADIDKILGKETPPKQSALQKAVFAIDAALPGSTAVPAEEKKEVKSKELTVGQLTPGKRDLLTAIEKKLNKIGYEATIRFMYIAPPDNFSRAHVSGIFGLFRQFAGTNVFLPNKRTMTIDKGYLSQIFPSDKGFFAAQREYRKKWKMYRNYRRRLPSKTPVILNTEELATLYHLPGLGVRAPLFPRVDSKKGQPPPGLPTL